MKVLVTGGRGMLGHDIDRVFGDAGDDVTIAGRDDLDITSPEACQAVVPGHALVVNAAAWTKVDGAEEHEAEAFDANARGAANVARACAEHDAILVHISTDYVFAGDATSPYPEDAPIAPRSAYGRTKAAGEWAVRAVCPRSYIVRTAWLYGEHGPNFVKTMARLARERDRLTIVDDQRGQPTWTLDLAEGIRRLVAAEVPFGTYHGTSGGETTWCGFARAIVAELGMDPGMVHPITTDEFPLPAPRPAYSVLGHSAWRAAGVEPLPDWQDALRRSVHDVVGASR
jgi:dTDP-4-dehydrorhamnose reductase